MIGSNTLVFNRGYDNEGLWLCDGCLNLASNLSHVYARFYRKRGLSIFYYVEIRFGPRVYILLEQLDMYRCIDSLE